MAFILKGNMEGIIGRINEMIKHSHQEGSTIYEGTMPEETYRVVRIQVTDTENILVSSIRPEPFTPEASRLVLELSPFFSWGFPGPGSRQLAIALIYDATGNIEDAQQYYPEFLDRFVRNWGREWSINSVQVRGWVELKKRYAQMQESFRHDN